MSCYSCKYSQGPWFWNFFAFCNNSGISQSLKSGCLHGFSKFMCVSLSTDQCGKNALLDIKFGWEIPELLQKTKKFQNQGPWLYSILILYLLAFGWIEGNTIYHLPALTCASCGKHYRSASSRKYPLSASYRGNLHFRRYASIFLALPFCG